MLIKGTVKDDIKKQYRIDKEEDMKFNCMDKKLFIWLTCFFLLTFCCCNSDPREQTTHKQTFVVIEQSYMNGNTRVIVRDTETNVLYIDCYYGIVPLLNSDGTPKLYGK